VSNSICPAFNSYSPKSTLAFAPVYGTKVDVSGIVGLFNISSTPLVAFQSLLTWDTISESKAIVPLAS
jgi:hypothetical protein